MTERPRKDLDLPLPPWRTPRKEPARQPLSQDAIVAAALRIVDTEGLKGVSMRRVAQDLDTGPASLYAYVSGKDELLDLVFERVLVDVDIPAEPDPESWDEQLRHLCWELYRVVNSHRDLASVALANVPAGPNSLRISEQMLGILLAGGVPEQEAAWALDRIMLYVSADAYEGSLYTSRRPEGMTDEEFIRQYFGGLHAYFTTLPPEEFPHITGLADAMMQGGGDQRFGFGLDLLIGGLVARTQTSTER